MRAAKSQRTHLETLHSPKLNTFSTPVNLLLQWVLVTKKEEAI
jgi:hypothetical protein